MQPVEAKRFVQDEMAAVFPVCNLRDRAKDAQARPPAAAAPALEDLPRLLGLVTPSGEEAAVAHPPRELDLRIKVAGFGGQGVLMLGEVLAEAGLDAGYEVSWLPSYGPEMRSGTSNCHVRLGNHAIDSPLVSRPNVLLALNEPSLRKFLPAMEAGGIVLYNGSEIPVDCVRRDVRMVALPFTELADELGAAKVGNIVMLGALLEATGMLEQDRVVGALKRLVHPRFFDLDVAALARGRQEFRESASDDYLWGV
jgi:Pyruvate/2-oxoacid:ferredoxin oxidoreductase gamma subunit